MNLWAERFAGWLLTGRQAGRASLIINDPELANLPRTLSLRSPAFAHQGAIALRHAGPGVGNNTSPPLEWDDVMPPATHWALVIEDPDVPLRRPFVHAIASGPARTTRLDEGELDTMRSANLVALGRNSFGKVGYAGPRPLPGHGTHRYVFQLFALLAPPPSAPSRNDLLRTLRSSAIASGRLDGLFARDRAGRAIVPVLPRD